MHARARAARGILAYEGVGILHLQLPSRRTKSGYTDFRVRSRFVPAFFTRWRTRRACVTPAALH